MYIVLYIYRTFSTEYGIFPSLKHLWHQIQGGTHSDTTVRKLGEKV